MSTEQEKLTREERAKKRFHLMEEIDRKLDVLLELAEQLKERFRRKMCNPTKVKGENK